MPPSQCSRQPNKVFVYGTLKSGEHNHPWLEHYGAKRIGDFWKTIVEYPLVVRGLPFLLPMVTWGGGVKGELYEVTDEGLNALDMLEGHPEGYTRQTVMLLPIGSKDPLTAVRAFAYFMIDPSLIRKVRTKKLKTTSWFTDTNQPEPA